MSSARLLVDYDAALAALLTEVEACAAGDAITLRLYIIEPGASSEAVLDALGRAAERGVTVAISVDATAASRLSRLWERTSTLLPRARALARAFPGRVTAVGRRTPDHSKVALFRRAGGRSSALLGGVNLGDRFRPWRDFMVRLEGEALVDDLARRLAGEGAAPALGPSAPPLAFAVNLPEAGRFEIAPALRALAAEPRLVRFRIAMAYLDRAGAAVLRAMLTRGAAVELVLPRRANVYQHANLRALSELLAAAPALRARLHPAMVHAKALLAWDAAGERVAFLGSANLKRNSLRMLGELNLLARDEALTGALDAALARLVEESAPVLEPPRYNPAFASVEERFG